MRTPVICKNCGIKWMRVTQPPMAGGNGDIELSSDLQCNCPKCGSNWYEEITND